MKRERQANGPRQVSALPATSEEISMWHCSVASSGYEVRVELDVYDDGESGVPGTNASVLLKFERRASAPEQWARRGEVMKDLEINTAELAPLIACLARTLELAQAAGVVK